MRAVRGGADTPVAMDPERFRELGHRLVDEISEFLAGLPDRPVVPPEGPEELRALIGGEASLPETGSDARELLDEAARLLFDHSTFNAHPKFLGYITAGPTPLGILADLLASAVNANCGAWILSPMASEIEGQAVRWMAELVGYPRECGGLLVSGGNMANFTGFLAGRTAVMGEAVRERGLRALDADPVVYVSAETHTWVQKAADLFGLGTGVVRWIETDSDLRMDVGSLERAIESDRAAGLWPIMVVGTAGSVSTGAVDPLRALAGVCRERGLWFHVDGAYGGFAAAVPGAHPELAHLGMADSIAIDPHKWLYAPLEAGCALVREPSDLRAAFAYHPAYYHFGVEATNYVDFGLQNSRGFRALKVWLALRQAGRRGYERMISDDIALAAHLAGRVREHPELELFTNELSITTFRYVPAALRPRVGEAGTEERLNELNQSLLDRLQKAGRAFLSNAVIGGRYTLRSCVVNFNTTSIDMDEIPGIVAELGRELAGEMGLSGEADAG